jgi:hypothetical protein
MYVVPAPGDAGGAEVGASDAGGLTDAAGAVDGVALGGVNEDAASDGLVDAAGAPQAAITRHRATSGPGPIRRIGQFGW